MDSNENIKDLSGGDCNTLESFTLDVWIIHIEWMDYEGAHGCEVLH
jgi:hypothetical protein